MNPLSMPFVQFECFVLILIRVLAIVLVLPVVSGRQVPIPVKLGFSLALALVVYPAVGTVGIAVPRSGLALLVALLREIGIGLLIGFLGQLVFAGIQVAGQLIGYQMGFGIVSVMDPQGSQQISIIAIFEHLLAMFLFFVFNVHHLMIQAVAESFRLIPLLQGRYPLSVMEQLLRNSASLFVTAIQIGAPVMAVLLFANLSMGLISRTVPQMNVFIVAFPLQIGVGLLMLGLSLPVTAGMFHRIFATLGRDVGILLRMMAG